MTEVNEAEATQRLEADSSGEIGVPAARLWARKLSARCSTSASAAEPCPRR